MGDTQDSIRHAPMPSDCYLFYHPTYRDCIPETAFRVEEGEGRGILDGMLDGMLHGMLDGMIHSVLCGMLHDM